MLNRLLIIPAVLIIMGFHEWNRPSTAQASGWSCSINEADKPYLVGLTLEDFWVAKCGGATGTDFNISISLQYENGGTWHNSGCGSYACVRYNPSPYPAFFNSGTQHSDTEIWSNQNGGYLCNVRYRIRLDAIDRTGGGSSDTPVFSPTLNTTC